MSEFVHSKELLVVYTNKNSSIFYKASNMVLDTYDLQGNVIGILYDDFDIDTTIRDRWVRKYNNIQIMTVAPRKKTVKMDDKINFSKIMADSLYVPKWYISPNDIEPDTPENQLFFVKERGSTSARGVYIYSYKDIRDKNVTVTSSSIIHKNMISPKLLDGKRYKVRVYVLISHGNIYVCRNAWGSSSDINYIEYDGTASQKTLNDMHIIYMRPGRKFFSFKDIEDSEKIFDSMCKSVRDFGIRFKDDISKFDKNEYSILGFDYVVDSNNNAYIIEINHRSNYHHTLEINETVDIPAISDTMKVMVDGLINLNKEDICLNHNCHDEFVFNDTDYVKVYSLFDE